MDTTPCPPNTSITTSHAWDVALQRTMVRLATSQRTALETVFRLYQTDHGGSGGQCGDAHGRHTVPLVEMVGAMLPRHMFQNEDAVRAYPDGDFEYDGPESPTGGHVLRQYRVRRVPGVRTYAFEWGRRTRRNG